MFNRSRKTGSTLATSVGLGVAGLGLVLAGCTSAPAPSGPSAGEPTAEATGAAGVIAQATQKTTDAGSARFSGSISGVGLPGGVGNTEGSSTVKMEGAYDFTNRQLDATASVGALGENGKIRIISTDGNTYMQMPQIGDKWLKANLSELGMSDTFTNPEEAFAQLRNVANLREVGPDTVDGVQATKYTGTVDLNAALADSGVSEQDLKGQELDGTSDMAVWVDGEGRVIKMTSRTAATLGKQDVSNEATMRFYDFGAELEIDPPPPGDVTDLSDLSKIPGEADLDKLQNG